MWNTNQLGLSMPGFPATTLPSQRHATESEIVAELSRRIEQSCHSRIASIAKKAAEDKRLVREKLSDEDTFAVTYVPFAIAEVAWDYIDTIMNFAQFLRLDDTKKLCRSIRELRREYDRKRFKVIDDAMRQSEIDNAILFQEELEDFFGLMHKKFNDSIKECYPDLCYDHLLMLSAVYGCENVLDALFRYAVLQQDKVSVILGYEIASILPPELKKLRSAVMGFYGSHTPTEETKQCRQSYIDELVKYMGNIAINDV